MVFASYLGRQLRRGKRTLYVTPGKYGLPVPHGFRSMLHTWAKAAGYTRELAEDALDHQIQRQTERRYGG